MYVFMSTDESTHACTSSVRNFWLNANSQLQYACVRACGRACARHRMFWWWGWAWREKTKLSFGSKMYCWLLLLLLCLFFFVICFTPPVCTHDLMGGPINNWIKKWINGSEPPQHRPKHIHIGVAELDIYSCRCSYIYNGGRLYENL